MKFLKYLHEKGNILPKEEGIVNLEAPQGRERKVSEVSMLAAYALLTVLSLRELRCIHGCPTEIRSQLRPPEMRMPF